MSDEDGNNLLNPGDTPHANVQFLVFCSAVVRAVDKFQGLLRMAIAAAGNDHRLGANEAPPAIISIFLGDMLTDIFSQIEKGGATGTKQGGILHTGVSVLPQLPRDAGDRNRTSPFAFTGNKFEFRAVGSSQSIAFPNICLNLAVAESLDAVASELEAAVKGGEKLEDAVSKLLTRLVKEHKRIIFNGNNYSQEWQDEAGRRGLLNHRNTVDALPELVKPDVVKTFDKYKVLNEREVRARYEIALEHYNKVVNIEGQSMTHLAHRYILPAALEYQKRVAESVGATKAAGVDCPEGRKLLDEVCGLACELRRRTEALQHALDHQGSESAEAHAKHYRDKVVPAMVALRETGDKLETLVPHDVWPLPTYREMLFLK
jgi:glutamine synthetase